MNGKNRYSGIKGFNYMPPYAYVVNDVMDRFSAKIFENNFAVAAEIGTNSLRIFFSSESYFRNGRAFLKNFEKILSVAEVNKLTVMPVLFNRWTDYGYHVGQLDLSSILYAEVAGSLLGYVKDVLTAFKGDGRILMWDLCNEPFFPVMDDDKALWEGIKKRECAFWRRILEEARGVGDGAVPLTVGFGGPPENTPEELFGLVDVIGIHPYEDYEGEGFAGFIRKFERIGEKYAKPLLCTETCQGSLDDGVRAKCIELSLGTLEKMGYGWYAWTLFAGHMTSARRDRTDLNAKAGDRGYFPFVMQDGTFRPGHDAVLKFTNGKTPVRRPRGISPR